MSGTSTGAPTAADVLAALAAPASQPAAEAKLAAAAAREARHLAAAANANSAKLAAMDRPTRIAGVRSRLLLKYLGVNLEMFNTGDMVYAGPAAGTDVSAGSAQPT
jgi:hypothetical protein